MNEAVIIGGGIHGTHISNVLCRDLGWREDRLKVIDPHECSCGRWKELTARVGMEFLRSPIVHHLGLSPWDLIQFKKHNSSSQWATSLGSKERPSLAMFNRHIDSVCENSGLQELRVRAEALSVRPFGPGLRVETTAGRFDTRRVVLAINSNDQPAIPSWAEGFKDCARHIFEPCYSHDWALASGEIAVVGAGITAAQAAILISDRAPGRVVLLSRAPLEVAEYDSDACWMGPKCLNRFALEKSYSRRRQLIQAARNKGTLTPEVFRELRRAERLGRLKLAVGNVEAVRCLDDGVVALLDSSGIELAAAGRVVLATGFLPGRR